MQRVLCKLSLSDSIRWQPATRIQRMVILHEASGRFGYTLNVNTFVDSSPNWLMMRTAIFCPFRLSRIE